MSDAEKLVDTGVKYPAEPLILRPPVGNEVLRVINLDGSRHGFCRSRSLILRLMLACILLALAAGGVLIIFALRHSDVWPWHQYSPLVSRVGRCRVITPFPEYNMGETYRFEPKAITIAHGPVSGFPPVWVYHLLNDAMTVMRTKGTCYIYPLSPEVAEVVPTDESMLERIREADQSLGEVRTTIEPRMYVVSPSSQDRPLINHPAAAANCSDVPIFRLMEMVQASFSLNNEVQPEGNLSPGCPKECPIGESRDLPGERVRQVCRCAPTPDVLQIPPALPPVAEGPNLILDSDDTDVQIDEPEPYAAEDIDDPINIGDADNIDLSSGPAWFPEEGEVVRSRRSAEKKSDAMKPLVRVPKCCQKVESVLEGAVPGSPRHHVPVMQIVNCHQRCHD